ncbi:hypothetical protein [Streptomyces sp. NPDC001970]
MSITTTVPAHLLATVSMPGGGALVNGFALESRAGGAHRALLRSWDELVVHDLDRLWAGETEPVASFPFPWQEWDHGVHSVSPDGSFAVFSGQRGVRAVGADGRMLWEFGHSCWARHEHECDEDRVCAMSDSGSVRVSDDGRFVWAHVAGGEAEDWDEQWVVLDAQDGTELARTALDSAASGSSHLTHPDGVHMGLGIGMGQDGILLYWGRWDGSSLTTWDLNETLDRILADVHPDHGGFLSLEHYGDDITLHMLEGEALATGRSDVLPPVGREEPAEGEEPDEDEDPPCWDYACGFVDADTVIATTTEYDEDPDLARHWLLDVHSLGIRGRITYPEPVDSLVRPLGDGTWLTYDDKRGVLSRWGTEPR